MDIISRQTVGAGWELSALDLREWADAQAERGSNMELVRLAVSDHPERIEVAIDRTTGRAGVVWGGNATWLRDVESDETAEAVAHRATEIGE